VPRSATAMVDALEATGLVERRPDPLDRRSVLVCLTDAGDELLARLSRARRAGAEALFARLDAAQCSQLLELLTVLNRRDTPSPRAGAPS
jgi:DNA-binding MarR family transcriptional regulator